MADLLNLERSPGPDTGRPGDVPFRQHLFSHLAVWFRSIQAELNATWRSIGESRNCRRLHKTGGSLQVQAGRTEGNTKRERIRRTFAALTNAGWLSARRQSECCACPRCPSWWCSRQALVYRFRQGTCRSGRETWGLTSRGNAPIQ